MAFPADPLPVVVQAAFDGSTWTTITDDVYVRDGIEITRGQADEQAAPEASRVSLTLDNRTGNYSPRNPSGTWYSQIGRNTQLRVALRSDQAWLSLPGPTGTQPAGGQRLSAPDTAGLSITGDLDLRWDGALDTYARTTELVSKWHSAANQRSYALALYQGRIRLWTSPTGATSTTHTSTRRVPRASGRIALRATLDVDNGAGGRVATFYTAPTMAGPWTVLDQITYTSTTTVFDSTTPVVIGESPDAAIAFDVVRGRVHGVQIRQGIAGTLRADVDLGAQTPGVSSFADGQGNTWTITGDGEITDLDVRGHGEVAAWPVRWDTSGSDAWAPITADGILRRLGQGAAALRSALYRAATDESRTNVVVAYWPCEDSPGSSQIASGLPGGRAMTIAADDNTDFAAYTGFGASEALPTLANKSAWSGSIRSYTATGSIQLQWLMAVPAGGATGGQTIIQVNTSGAAARWLVRYETGGNITVLAFAPDGSSLGSWGPYSFALNGSAVKASLDLTTSGSNTNLGFSTLVPGAALGGGFSATLTGSTIGRATAVVVSPGAGLSDVSLGHVSVHNSIDNLFDLSTQLNAWRGEAAGRRIERLCAEEGIPFRVLGDLDDTVPTGYQRARAVLDLLVEAATADGGILAEPRDGLGLTYVPRAALINQDAALSVPYGHTRDLEPTDDDQLVVNDVEVSRDGGSSVQVALTDGPLSVQAPPDGIGRYASSDTISLGYDYQLGDRAGWRLHLGTVDEPRFPTIGLDLEHPDIAADTALTAAARGLDLGHRLTLTGTKPVWLPPGDIDQIALGLVERLGVYEHTLTATCVPYSPYRTGMYDDADTARYDTGGSVLASAIGTTTTTLSVTTSTGPRWTTTAGSFPFDITIGGETITVTTISGTGATQTFTVTRSTNGAVLAHGAGAVVALAQPAVYGL